MISHETIFNVPGGRSGVDEKDVGHEERMKAEG
jgi:hypothetical protein